MYSGDTRGGWCCCLGAPDGLRAVRAEELARRHCRRAKLAMPLVEEIIEAALRFGTGGWRRAGSNGFVREVWPELGGAANEGSSRQQKMRRKVKVSRCERARASASRRGNWGRVHGPDAGAWGSF